MILYSCPDISLLSVRWIVKAILGRFLLASVRTTPSAGSRQSLKSQRTDFRTYEGRVGGASTSSISASIRRSVAGLSKNCCDPVCCEAESLGLSDDALESVRCIAKDFELAVCDKWC